MDIWSWFSGLVRVEIVCADQNATLSAITNAGIELRQVRTLEDGLRLTLTIHRKDRAKLEMIAARKGFLAQKKGNAGLPWIVASLRKRPILTFGMAIILALSLYLPTRVLFVSVEGNISIPTRLILEKAQACGLTFGATRRDVRSESMKNALMDAIPQLQWAGINTYGCTAVITVREREMEESKNDTQGEFSCLVAICDGVISRFTVTKGTNLCQIGQAVRKGQLLVSGYTDCGICIRAGRAEGEIFATTERKMRSLSPAKWVEKGEMIRKSENYALIIWKNRINFYKGSGFSDGSCDKMYSEYYVTLPGGYLLPICIVREVSLVRKCDDLAVNEEQILSTLSSNAKHYLTSQMISGKLMRSQEEHDIIGDFLVLDGRYVCEEMIAKIQYEENLDLNGKRK